MPFDGLDFPPKPRQPDRAPPGERVFTLMFLVLAICSLVMPISMAALVDIIQFIRGK